MGKILLNVKNSAQDKEILHSIKVESSSGFALEIRQEEPPRKPILSQAPVGVHEVITQLAQLFGADSIVRIVIEGEIYDFIKGFAKDSWAAFIKFIGANNKQKGNAWGVKLEMKRKVAHGEQTLHFFIDKIPQESLGDALEAIASKIEKLNDALGEDYLRQVKNIGFEFGASDGEWHIMGVETFEGKTEVPKEKEAH